MPGVADVIQACGNILKRNSKIRLLTEQGDNAIAQGRNNIVLIM